MIKELKNIRKNDNVLLIEPYCSGYFHSTINTIIILLVNEISDNITFLSSYSQLTIIKSILNENGNTQIKIKIKKSPKIFTFSLKKPRKFDFTTFNHIKNKEYVKKITF